MNLDDALAEIYSLGTAEERGAKAAELFGDKVAYSMTPMLNASAEDMAAMRQEAHDLGVVMDEDAVKAGASMNDMFSKVSDSFSAIVNQIGVQVMPIVAMLLQWVLDHMPEIQSVISSVVVTIKNVVQQLMPVIQALTPIVEQVFERIVNVWQTVLYPILAEIINFVTNVLQGKWRDAFENLGKIVRDVFNGMVSAVKMPLNAIITAINTFLKGLGSIKAPDWVPVIGGKEFSLPTIPLLAKGGDIVGAGSAIVGEAGAELVQLPVGARVTPLGGSADNIIDYDKLANAIAVAMRQVTVETNVNLIGDASAMFDVMRDKNQAFKRATGRSAFA